MAKPRAVHATVSARHPRQLVSAGARTQRWVLGPEATAETANEITALPQLLQRLARTGGRGTREAMGCQGPSAEQLAAHGGDSVRGLTGTPRHRREAVEDCLAVAQQANFAPRRDDSADAGDNDPGRLELRRYWSTAARRTRPATDRWVGLPRLGRVERTAVLGDTQTGEQRDFMSSLRADAQGFAQGVRGHGGVETRRHGRLHVVFGDDASRLRTGTAPTLMTSSRHLGIKLFDQPPSALRLAKQRRQAAWNDDFRAKVLCG